MAVAPFNIDTSTPGDTDVVMVYPVNERSFRDIVKSWFLSQWNINGQTEVIKFSPQGASPTIGTGLIGLWANSVNQLFTRAGAGTVVQLGVPAGSVTIYAGVTLPDGWLWCNGQSYVRASFPELFSIIGTTYGAADGSHFNVPDLLERVPMGRGDMGGAGDPGRVTNAISGFDPTILGSTGGTESANLAQTALPNVTLALTGNVTNGSVTIGNQAQFVTNAQPAGAGFSTYSVGAGSLGFTGVLASTALTGTTASLNTGVAQTPYLKVQPVIAMNYIIKT